MTHLALLCKRDSLRHNPRIISISNLADAQRELGKIGADPYGIEAMLPKMQTLNLKLENVECRVANILKQEMLSLGADAAVSRLSVSCQAASTDVILIGTRKQLGKLLAKLDRQPFGLDNLARDLKTVLYNAGGSAFILKTSRREIHIGPRTLVMGILNVTPDSFSDGGSFYDFKAALKRFEDLVRDGADIIDIGGESTRPGAVPVPAEEEAKRIIPLIKELAKDCPVPISVDTAKDSIARQALELGAEIINDISALSGSPGMAEAVRGAGAALVLMHMRGTPRTMQTGDLSYGSLWGEIVSFLKERIDLAEASGIDSRRIIVDPGIGFGKSAEDNVRLIKHLRELKVLGKPVMIGPSRKGFIGKFTHAQDPADRFGGTAAAVCASILNGANIVRIHDVKLLKPLVIMADEIARA